MLPAHFGGLFLFTFLTGGLVSASLFGTWRCLAPLRGAVRAPWAMSDEGARRCRYCRLGRAFLHEEKVRVEDDDLVEVRLFVCGTCGLPTWSVERSPLPKKAA